MEVNQAHLYGRWQAKNDRGDESVVGQWMHTLFPCLETLVHWIRSNRLWHKWLGHIQQMDELTPPHDGIGFFRWHSLRGWLAGLGSSPSRTTTCGRNQNCLIATKISYSLALRHLPWGELNQVRFCGSKSTRNLIGQLTWPRKPIDSVSTMHRTFLKHSL